MSKTIKKPIKIINLLSRMNIGGPSVHTVLLTKYLDSEKFQSMLVSGSLSEGEGDMSYLVDQYKIEHRTIESLQREISFIHDFKAILELYKLFRQEQPHIVHTNLAKAGMVGRVAAWFAGVPIILHTYHGHVFSGYFSKAKTSLYIYIERYMAFLSTRIIAISNMVKKDICSVYNIASEKKISVIPLGFELSSMEPLDKYKGTFRKNFSIPDEAPVIGIVGRLTDIKNHSLFVDIANLLLKQNNEIHFLIVGDGELRTVLENKVKELDLSNVIHFTGWVSETAKMYADMDLMLLSSKNEGTPVTVIEAMYYKIPVVSTNVGGLPDLIMDSKSGFLVNSFIAEDYIEVILKLISSEHLRDQIGLEAHKFIRNQFNVNRLVQDITELYIELLNKKGFEC